MNKYYLINRPGVFPVGSSDSETWHPVRQIPGTERYVHGWASYPEPLDPWKIWKYEMLPADENELEDYWNWRDENEM